jgi:putative membrane-bound dehydrogenase-like protein
MTSSHGSDRSGSRQTSGLHSARNLPKSGVFGYEYSTPLLNHIVFLAVTVIAACGFTTAAAQETPVESLRSLRPADGLQVSLWASEPMVNNPTAMDIDSRGRVWIAEGLNYRMKQKQFDTLTRVDGADRIKILTDTDGDGHADKVTVFADNIFPVPLGLAVEEIWEDGRYRGARAYVGNSPDLLVLEDTDGDDRADRRYSLLTGFRGIDSDHGLHGMTFGPDGMLYFTVGDARYGADKVQTGDPTFDVTDKLGRRVSASRSGTTLRVNLDGTKFEVLAYGQRNNYETSVDSFGNVFSSDNDDDGNRGCRTIWIMEGGQYGYLDPRSSRHWAEELPGIIPKIVGTGNGAPGGLTVYEGDLLPQTSFYSVLQVDAGTRQLNSHPLKRYGAGFRSDYKVLLKSEDSWFRPVDVSVAPDGSVFVCDWYDAGVGGNRFSDQTTGRIYWLRPKNYDAASRSGQPDFDSVDGQILALRSPNVATRFAARRSLLKRAGDARPPLQELFRRGRPHERARALFVLADLPDTGHDDVVAALRHSEPQIRETALQILARDASRESVVSPQSARKTQPPAVTELSNILPLANDPDAGVRRALIMSLRNVSTERVGGELKMLAAAWDGRDRYYLEALRAALRHRDTEFLQSLFEDLTRRAVTDGWNDERVAIPPYFPITTNDAFLRPEDRLPPSNAAAKLVGLAWVLERPEAIGALRRILAENESRAIEQAADLALSRINDPGAGELLIARYIAANKDRGRQRELLKRLANGIAGPWKTLREKATFRDIIDSALEQTSLRVEAIRTIARTKVKGYSTPLLSLAGNESADRFARAAAIETLGKLRHPAVRELAAHLISEAKNQSRGGPLSLAALVAISEFPDVDGHDFLAKVIVDAQYPLDLRRRALQVVVTRSAGVDQMMSLHGSGKFPSDLLSELTFLLHNHADRRVRQTAATALPLPKTGSGKPLADLQAVLAIKADTERGHTVFHQNKDTACARCHRVQGEGHWVGPDLSSIGTKYGKQELLYHILNPSGAINYNYVSHTIVLADGRVLSGLIVGRTDSSIVLKTATGDRKEIPLDEIELQRAQNVSLMPADLVAKLTEQDLADLIAYLATLRKPVSTATEYYVLGPLPQTSPASHRVPDLQSMWSGADGSDVRWQRAATESDGRLDLSVQLGSRQGRIVLCYLPVNSPGRQNARIVFNSASPIDAWINGETVGVERQQNGPESNISSAGFALQRGVNHLVIRLASGSDTADVTTTLITNREISYSVAALANEEHGSEE